MNSGPQSTQAQRLNPIPGIVGPKDNDDREMEQPPAYTPSARSGIIEDIAAYIAHQAATHDTHTHRVVSYPDVSVSGGLLDDEVEELSPISLNISTSINVASDGNIIALPYSPAEQANSIAKAVVAAIQGQDWATGLPMIDENGRPRSVRLEVDAGITVKGASNVIGTESVIHEFLRRSSQSQVRSPSVQRRIWTSSAPTSSTSPKRKRQASDYLDSPQRSPCKRARSEE